MKLTDKNCFDFFLEKTKNLGKYCAIKYLGNKIYSDKFLCDIECLSNYFLSSGLKKGDVVCIFLPNTPHAVVSFYALNKIGVIAHIVHPITPPEALKKALQKTKAKNIFILDILAKDYIDVLNQLDISIILCRNSDYFANILKPFLKIYEFFKCVKIGRLNKVVKYSHLIKYKKQHISSDIGNEIATYMHSGGTSDESKIIMLDSKSFNHVAENTLKLAINVEPKTECGLVALPIFHAYGLGVGIHTSFCKGVVAILMPKFDPKTMIKYMRKNKVVFLAGVPGMFAKMMRAKGFDGKHLKNLKHVYCGGDATNVNLINEFNNRVKNSGGDCKICAGYGLTETCSVIAANTNEHYKIGSNGKSFNGIKIEIWDENNEKLPASTRGEICISGNTVMLGYYASDNLGIYVDKNKTRWVKTGDIGYLDEEGYLYFVSRKKRMVKISAFNIFPSDIEEVVLECEYIKEACAVGVQSGKPFIRLFITLKGKYEYNNAVYEEILSLCKKRLIKHACPREIIVLNEMPRTNLGKIDYVKLEKYKSEN